MLRIRIRPQLKKTWSWSKFTLKIKQLQFLTIFLACLLLFLNFPSWIRIQGGKCMRIHAYPAPQTCSTYLYRYRYLVIFKRYSIVIIINCVLGLSMGTGRWAARPRSLAAPHSSLTSSFSTFRARTYPKIR